MSALDLPTVRTLVKHRNDDTDTRAAALRDLWRRQAEAEIARRRAAK